MISIRKYLDGPPALLNIEAPEPRNRRSTADLLAVYRDAYRSSLSEMGRSSIDVCAPTGTALENSLLKAADDLGSSQTADAVVASAANVRVHLKEWARSTAGHFQQKAGEVKEILLVMVQTTESVSRRDQRCADQLQAITTSLKRIATLDDISTMRRAIERSAADLRTSIDRLAEQGRAVHDEMQAKITAFQAKLEEAEEIVACDPLTRLRSRLYMEGQLDQRIAAAARFSVAILDVDGFKNVNDTHGHGIGDDLLKQFATELRSACRSYDIVGRWGGDEFLVLLDCGIEQAMAQIERVSKWVCGNYVVRGVEGQTKVNVGASIGLAQFTPPESRKDLLDRADNAMYRNKRAGQAPTTSGRSGL